MKEEFKIIQGYPDYRVSNLGYVQSNRKNKGWVTLSVCPDKKRGYVNVGLSDGCSPPKTLRIHRIVAAAFLGKCPYKNAVRHLDGNGSNNRLDNLAYGTYAENERDKIAHGIDLRLANAKLTPEIVKEIRELIKKDGGTDDFYAKKYSVSRPTITRLKNYVIWK